MNLEKVGPGRKVPDVVNALIEISLGSNVKYELDKESGVLFVDRFLFTSMVYPANYGFVPGTLAEDGDPVDILVLSSYPVVPLSVIECRPVGVLIMEDESGMDEKILSVPVADVDPSFSSVLIYSDLPDTILEKIKHFFEHYKDLEPGKWVKLKEYKGPEEAKKMIMEAVERYKAGG